MFTYFLITSINIKTLFDHGILNKDWRNINYFYVTELNRIDIFVVIKVIKELMCFINIFIERFCDQGIFAKLWLIKPFD